MQLQDDDEYADIVEDIRIECEECGGRVVEVQIPRICEDPCLDPRHIHDPEEIKQKAEDGDASFASAVGVKREENNGGAAAPETSLVRGEHSSVQTETKDRKTEPNDADEMVTEDMVLEALQGKTKVMPPMVGYAYVAFIDCEASANARKVWHFLP